MAWYVPNEFAIHKSTYKGIERAKERMGVYIRSKSKLLDFIITSSSTSSMRGIKEDSPEILLVLDHLVIFQCAS
jgi:hypothetical protein